DGASPTPSTVDVAAGVATYNVDPGEIVRCTFIDTGSRVDSSGIIVEKLGVNGEFAGALFHFTAAACGGGFDLAVPQRSGVCTTGPGSFTVAEDQLPAGFRLQDIRC